MLTERRLHRLVSVLLIAGVLLSGCAAQAPAPIEGKGNTAAPAPARPPLQRAPRARSTAPDTYRVQRGDTLYTIAFRFGLDHRQIAQWNGLDNPNRILVGQALRLKPKSSSPAAAVARATAAPPANVSAATPMPPVGVPVQPSATAMPDAVQRPPPAADSVAAVPANVATPPVALGGSRSVNGVSWTWPAAGKTRRAVAASGSEGLEIVGARGQPVVAAAAGQVVYSGNGLRGYGQLIIIKHNDTFLSAYAHNDKLLVTEGTRVNAGQQIAQMGDSEASEVMLHFEIRKSGKAVGPLQFLPQR